MIAIAITTFAVLDCALIALFIIQKKRHDKADLY